MMYDTARIPPVSLETATDEQRACLNGWAADLNCCRVLAQHPELSQAFYPLIAKVIPHTALPPRDRQILVLRTLALCNEHYESTHHETISHNAGLTDADIEAARTGSESLSPFERLLVKAADELVREHCVSDETWAQLAERYSQTELMEVVGLVSAYTALAMMFRSYGVQLEDPEVFKTFQPQRTYV